MTLEMAQSYDWVNTIFTHYSAASVTMISTDNPSTDLFVYVMAIEGHYKVTNATMPTAA